MTYNPDHNLIYCRRRGRKDATNCRVKTKAISGICSECQSDLEALAEDLDFIKELKEY